MQKSNDTMKKIIARNVLTVFISLALVHALAAPAAIGIATAKGSFRVDDAYVAGNATLFEGTAVETGKTTSELNLSKANIVMATDSRGRVFQDRLILDKGKVQWVGSNFQTLAGEILIVGAASGSKALVERRGETVQVASLAGTVNVFSSTGESLMAVGAGTAYDFTPEPQGAVPGDKKDTATTSTAKKGGKMSTAAKVWITVAAVGASGAAAGVLATRDSGSTTSR